MNAFDDLPPNSPEMQAVVPKGGNAFDDLTPPVKEAATAPAASSIPQQLERGAGLTTRALVEGVTGFPGMLLDVGHSVSKLATDSGYRAATWEQMKHPSRWLEMPADLPSQQFSHAMDPYLPRPETTAEKLMSVGLGMEGGGMTPQVPVPGSAAPANFMPPAQQKAQLLAAQLQKAQDAGYVVPPSTTNPTRFNRVLESVAGKENTQNEARAINQEARNTGAATDLGLKPEVFTPGAVAAVKKEAGEAFQQARGIPRINTDENYSADLDKVLSTNHGANADFPGAANPDVEKIVTTYRQPSFTGNSAVSAVELLRQKATDAYRNGQSELGAAYKGVSGAIERQMERGALRLEEPPEPFQHSLSMGFADQADISSRQLTNKFVPTEFGPNGPMVYDHASGKWKIEPQTAIKSVLEPQEFGPSQQLGMPFATRAEESFAPPTLRAAPGQYSKLVDALRKARQRYAQASTIEDSMDAAGNVSGPKLAAAWNRNEPLSGNTLQAAEHAVNYPKANLPANSSNVRKLSFGASMVGAAEGYHVGGLKGAALGGALPLTSEGARAYLLGPGQSNALPAAARKASALAQALKARTPQALAGGAADAP